MKAIILPIFIGCAFSYSAVAQNLPIALSEESEPLAISMISSAVDADTSSLATAEEDAEIIEGKAYADVGLDLLNNFLWRGIPLDPGPNFQPAIIVGYGNVELGFLGSYSLRHDFNNILTYLTYNIETKYGTFKPKVVDYYYPYDPVEFSNFKNRVDGPASFSHTIETGLGYTGKEVPISVYGSVNVLNDPLHSTYLEVAYKMDLNGIEFEPFVGGVLNESPLWHAADKAGIINLGVNAYKTIQITKEYGLPLTGTLVWHSQLNMLNVMVRMSIF